MKVVDEENSNKSFDSKVVVLEVILGKLCMLTQRDQDTTL